MCTMAGNSQSSYVDDESRRDETSMETMSEDEIKELIHELMKVSEVDEELAYLILDMDVTDLKTLGEVSVERLATIDGLTKKRAKGIIEEARKMSDYGVAGKNESIPTEEDEDELAKWLTGGTGVDLTGLLEKEVVEKSKKSTEPGKTATDKDVSGEDYDALKSWLTGESDSFSDWLGEESFEEEREEFEEVIAEKEEHLAESRREMDTKLRQIEELKSELENRLKGLDTGEFDPQQLVRENVELREEIGTLEVAVEALKDEREELEREADELKKGSIALLRYFSTNKTRLLSEGTDTGIGTFASSEELSALEDENLRLKSRLNAMESSGEFEDMDHLELVEKLKLRENQVDRYEREIKEKTHKIQEFQNELTFKKEELEQLKEKMRYKEEELNKHEADLQHREEVMKKEIMELQLLKQEFGGATEKERSRRMEDLEKEISRKEHELKAKERYIEQKQRELRAREEELIDEELEERREEILHEIEQEKAKTGTSRLDDLLLGGFPLGTNISVYGPPHVGKRVLINSFIAEGLEKGVPAIWVITDKTINEVRQEMKFVLPTYNEYEIRGLVYYVDAYSSSMGEIDEHEKGKDYITFIDEQSDLESITNAVEEFSARIKNTHRYYRMAFESVSTLIAYLDTTTTFRSLQPFAGRRKKDKAVALYILEKGMHSEQDISMLGHMMDGDVEFKFQQLQTYLRVAGLGDVQTRQWVKYQHSKSGITMGSFSLDTIR